MGSIAFVHLSLSTFKTVKCNIITSLRPTDIALLVMCLLCKPGSTSVDLQNENKKPRMMAYSSYFSNEESGMEVCCPTTLVEVLSEISEDITFYIILKKNKMERDEEGT